DRVAAGAEGAATGVDAEDAAPGLRGDAGAALHDGQLGDRPGGPAVGRAGYFVAHAGGAAGVLVVILLVAHVDPAVGGYARLARLLVAGRGDGVADKELRSPSDAAVGGFVAGDAAGGLVAVGEGDVNDVRVAWVHCNVRPVGGGDGRWRAPGGTAVGGLDDVGGGRAGVEDDRVDAAVGAVGDAGVAAGRLHAIGRGIGRGPGQAAVGGAEDADAGDAPVVRGPDGVHAVGRVGVDLEFVLVAAEHVAVAHAAVWAVVGGQHV